ncbi:hypothetical protein [Ruegeria jejuensis]|uniref:hypothetical protein n=1 Tax=Ruegeria jejuensis TaxID=3233338 RepID=UPI00355BC5DD
MSCTPDRRIIWIAASALAVSVIAPPVGAQTKDIRGSILYEDNGKIPEGRVFIYLENPAVQYKTRAIVPKTSVNSDGKSRVIEYSFSWPARLKASPELRVVARLERDDGWLIARGSAPFKTGAPAKITLNQALY